MMKFWQFFTRKGRAQAAREEEMKFRMRINELRRSVNMLNKAAERSKQEAIELEKAGKHVQAISKVRIAENQEKSYQAAVEQLATCEAMHAQAKVQNIFKKTMQVSADISRTVIGEIDMAGIEKAKEEMETSRMLLEQTQDTMLAFQQGLDAGEDPNYIKPADEEALAKLMKEHEEKEKTDSMIAPESQVIAEAPIPAAEASAEPMTEPQAWASSRRQALADLA